MSDRRCGRCGGSQTEGFLPDRAHNSARIGTWAEGPPEYWFLRILKMRGRRRLPIAAWRCAKCGLLDLYANEPSG
jgi:hypothetical protein